MPKANLTFSKCLEMKLDDHIQTIAKVAEVAGKEYSIEQVIRLHPVVLFSLKLVMNSLNVPFFFFFALETKKQNLFLIEVHPSTGYEIVKDKIWWVKDSRKGK